MKLILIFFISFSLFYGFCGHKNSIKNYLDGYKKTLIKMPYSESYLSDPNFQCLEEKLNLTNNGNKTIDAELAIATLTFGLIICSDSYIESDIEKKFEGIEKFVAKNPNVIKCMKWELHRTVKDSSYPDPQLNQSDTFACRKMKISDKIKKNFDSQFTFFTTNVSYVDCADFKANKIITLKMYILTEEEDEDTKSAGLRNIVNDSIGQNEKIFNCLKNFIENFKIKVKKH
ncbi:unnamed protein product [Chironomus riparius]|uniref:Uncharacterized protein n=1 Tax=Chironomus riparius TaxID=315576 RepID=A0A9N9S886_9DIPT|nr:unnamed protein product [Chironomus riparius]